MAWVRSCKWRASTLMPLFIITDRVTVLDTGVLQITDLRATDAGRYRCKAVNDAHSRHSFHATLAVVTGELSTQSLTVYLHLNIYAEDWYQMLHWRFCYYRNEEFLDVSTWNRVIVCVLFSLLFLFSLLCVEFDVFCCPSSTGSITKPARFLAGPQDQVVGVGKTAVFECLATGVPLPRIVWTREGT